MPDRPNILFIVTDQHRGDCIGADPQCPTDADGRSLVHTPNIDNFVQNGALFTSAYTPAPSCIPARRSLLTGQTPATNGAPGWVTDEWDFGTTLPKELRDGGYQTKLAGKIHSIPIRSNQGFESMDQHEALADHPNDDYEQWLAEKSEGLFDELTHGIGRNSWDPRPSHLPEHLHPTTWTTDRAIDFLEERDPTRPFFLNVSYVRPHTPLDPPQPYWDMYADRDLPDPYMGEWAEEMYGEKIPEFPATNAWVADLAPNTVHRARTGYYGLITQIDHQVKRIMFQLRKMDELANTFVMLISDHGEMLGDHFLWRKTYGYEGSARVPFLMRFPETMDAERKQFIDRPVGIEDVMPTLLSVADVDVPESVEGRNLLDLVADPGRDDWREWYHGEHAPGSYDPENGCQYGIGERTKYIWNPVTGEELLFGLDEDPGEERDLSSDPDHRSELQEWRNRMTDRLAGRSEGFVDDGDLSPIAPSGDLDIGDIDDCE